MASTGNLWLDEERLQGNFVMTDDGIDQSTFVIVFITKAYISKVNILGPKKHDDNCAIMEFWYAINRKGSENMIAVVMERVCSDQRTWTGIL